MLSPRAALACVLSLAALATAPAVADAGTVTVSRLAVAGNAASPVDKAGTITADGIDCGVDCTETFEAIETCKIVRGEEVCTFEFPDVTLSATANAAEGWQFSKLTGCSPKPATPASCTFDTGLNRTVEAHFTDIRPPQHAFQVGGLQRGEITFDAKPTDNWEIASVKYEVGGFPPHTATAHPWTLDFDTTKLADGALTVKAVVTDKAGLSVETPVQHFTIDNHAPTVIVTKAAEDKTYGPGETQEYEFGVKEVGPAGLKKVECRLDFGIYRSCSADRADTLKTTAHGRHTWQVRAVDEAGNETVESRGFDVDAIAPPVRITDAPKHVKAGHSVAFGFRADDSTAKFACRVYRIGGAEPGFGDCTGAGTHLVEDLAVGGYRFEVRATDPYGNFEEKPAQHEFFVGDSQPPVIVIHSAPADDTYGPGHQLEFGFTVSDGDGSGVKRVECRLDSEPEFRSCAGIDRVTVTAGGRHTWMVRAVDEADNPQTETRSFTIDATAPESTITDGPSGPVAGTAVAFTFAADDPQASFRCRVAALGAPAPGFGPCSGAATHTLSGLKSGVYRFEVLALDRFGNVEPVPAARDFTITVPPQRITSPISHGWREFPKRGYVKPTRLRVSDVPAGGKVTVVCRGGAQKGCPFKKRSLTGAKLNVGKKLDLLGRKFRKGAVLELRVTAPDMIGKVLRFKFGGGGRTPATTTLCTKPGAAQPVKC